jgi:hypothetical protein
MRLAHQLSSVTSREVLVRYSPLGTMLYKDMAATPFDAMSWRKLHHPVETHHGSSVEELHAGLCNAVPDSRRLIQVMLKSPLQCRTARNALVAGGGEADKAGFELLEECLQIAAVEVRYLLAL